MSDLGAREAMEFDVVIVGAGPAGPRRGDPGQAARARRQRVRGGEGQRGRRPHPIRRGGRATRAERADPRLAGQGRAAGHAGDRRPVPVPDGEAGNPPADAAGRCTTTETTSSPSATWCAGWASRRRRRGWRSIPASPPPRCWRRTVASSGSRPATWASARTASPPGSFARGMELRAAYTLFAEGCRGSLSKRLMARFNLRDGADPQTYAIGVKELWEVPADNHHPGLVEHTIGWPLDLRHLWRLVPLSSSAPTWSPSGSSSGWTTAIPGSIRSRRCSGSRRTRRSRASSTAGGASPTAHAP